MSEHISEHFLYAEFSCNHCNKLPPDGVHPELIRKLELIREHFDVPVTINSGYRCPTHNRNCGGAIGSQHLRGTAADIVVKGVPAHEVYKAVDPYHDDGGLGKYKTFTHIDVRGHRARWTG